MPNARINPGNKKGAALGAMMKLQTYSISGVKAMLLLKVVADEGHLNLDVAERAREILPQLPIFCNKSTIFS